MNNKYINNVNDHNKANLKLKKLDLGLKVVKKKFLSQIKLLKYSPSEKISHVLLRNTLIFHNVIFKVKKNTDFMHECVRKMKKHDIKKEDKSKLQIEVNDKQIINYALIKNLMNMINTFSIFDHDYEIESLSNENKTNILENIPKQYHSLIIDELKKIKPIMPSEMKKDEKVIEGFADPFSQAIDTIISGIKSVIGEIEKGIGVVKDFVLDIIEKIQAIFSQIFAFMEDVFKNLKDIVEFIGGFLMQCIDLFFKLLKFIWMLVTEWVPWFVTETWKFLIKYFNNIDVLPMCYLLQFPLDDTVSQIAEFAIPFSGHIFQFLNLGEFIAFYIFWIYPKSIRVIQNWFIDRIKSFVIYIATFGREAFGTSQDIAKAARDIFLPRWFVSAFKTLGPEMNLDVSGFTNDNLSITKKAENFLKFMIDNAFAIPAKLFIIAVMCLMVYRLMSPHMQYVIPTLREISAFPLVVIGDLKKAILR